MLNEFYGPCSFLRSIETSLSILNPYKRTGLLQAVLELSISWTGSPSFPYYCTLAFWLSRQRTWLIFHIVTRLLFSFNIATPKKTYAAQEHLISHSCILFLPSLGENTPCESRACRPDIVSRVSPHCLLNRGWYRHPIVVLGTEIVWERGVETKLVRFIKVNVHQLY